MLVLLSLLMCTKPWMGMASPQDHLAKAVAEGNVDAARDALHEGAEINGLDSFGITPLANAIWQLTPPDGCPWPTCTPLRLGAADEDGIVQIMKWLLDHGAQLEKKCQCGRCDSAETVMDLAVEKGRFKPMLWLEHRGVKRPFTPLGSGHDMGLNLSWPEFCDVCTKAAPDLGARLVERLTEDAARCWLDAGGDPWAALADGNFYYSRLKDEGAKKTWKERMTLVRQYVDTLRNPKTSMFVGGGVGLAFFLHMLFHQVVGPPTQLQSFWPGSLRLARTALKPSSASYMGPFRMLEVMASMVMPFGFAMLFVRWQVIIPLWCALYGLPLVLSHKMQKLQSPAIIIAATTRCEAAWAALRTLALAALSAPITLKHVFHSGISWRTGLGWLDGRVWDVQMFALDLLEPHSDWTLFLTNPRVGYQKGGESGLLRGKYLTLRTSKLPLAPITGQNLLITFFIIVATSSVAYIIACAVYAASGCCAGEGAPSLDEEKAKKNVRACAAAISQGKPIPPSILPEGEEMPREVGWKGIWWKPWTWMQGLWPKIALFLLDVALDINTVWTLLLADHYLFAASMAVLLTYSILYQVRYLNLLGIFNTVKASTEHGALRSDLILMLDTEKSLEAFIGLAITSYSFLYAVNTATQAATQILSILLSVHGLANYLHDEIDLKLGELEVEPELEEEEELDVRLLRCDACGACA